MEKYALHTSWPFQAVETKIPWVTYATNVHFPASLEVGEFQLKVQTEWVSSKGQLPGLLVILLLHCH